MYGMEFLKTWITTCTLTFSCIYQDEKHAKVLDKNDQSNRDSDFLLGMLIRQ
jgi:hypothetical protein